MSGPTTAGSRSEVVCFGEGLATECGGVFVFSLQLSDLSGLLADVLQTSMLRFH